MAKSKSTAARKSQPKSKTNKSARPTPHRIMQYFFGYAPPLMLEAGVRLGVFDALDSGAKTIEQVSEKTGASERGLRALMNGLVGLDFLSRSGVRYRLTPESKAFLVSGRPGFFGGMLRHTSQQLMPKWLQLTDIVRTGHPARAVNEKDSGAEFFAEFVEGLFPMSYPVAQALGEHLKVRSAKKPFRVLDLAAGSGVWGIGVAQKSPNVTVTAVDWPLVLDVTKKMTGKFRLSERFTFIPGDLHDADFGQGHDLATLGHILHSEGEARSRALLRKTYDALAPGGTIAIAEFLVDDDRTGPPGSLIFAVNMLVNTDQGDTFTFAQISQWLKHTGFVKPRLLKTPGGPSPLILANKSR